MCKWFRNRANITRPRAVQLTGGRVKKTLLLLLFIVTEIGGHRVPFEETQCGTGVWGLSARLG